jgi:hypothetical protein
LEGTANDYAASIEAVTRAVEVELQELDDWNCCGASAAHSISHSLALDLPMRNLLIAYQAALDVVVPCALCFNRLKVAEKALKGPEGHRWGQVSTNSVKIWDLLDYFTQEPLLKAVAEKIVTPLTGLKAVAYYGCLVTRPPEITDRADYENPRNMELLLRVLGATPIDWSFKTDCCGRGWRWPGRISSIPWCTVSMSGPWPRGRNAWWFPARCARPIWILPRSAFPRNSGRSIICRCSILRSLSAWPWGFPKPRAGWINISSIPSPS